MTFEPPLGDTITAKKLKKRTGITTRCNRRLQNIATFMYRIKNKTLPCTLLDLFNTTTSHYCLRNSSSVYSVYFCVPNTVKYGNLSLSYLGLSFNQIAE